MGQFPPLYIRVNYALRWNGKAWHYWESDEVVELWEQEEKDEAESSGVNLAHGLVSGGTMGIFLEEVTQIEEVNLWTFS